MENYKDIYDKDYKLLLGKDSSGEAIVKYSPKNSYMWKIYEKLYINGDPMKEGLYQFGIRNAVDMLLSHDSVLLAGEENLFEFQELKDCKITKLTKEHLPVNPMSIPLTKG